MSVEKSEAIYKMSDNIYSDLGFPEPEVYYYKSKLAMNILDIVEDQDISGDQLESLLALSKKSVNDLIHGRFSQFTTEQLLYFLNTLGRDIDIIIKKTDSELVGQISVQVQ